MAGLWARMLLPFARLTQVTRRKHLLPEITVINLYSEYSLVRAPATGGA